MEYRLDRKEKILIPLYKDTILNENEVEKLTRKNRKRLINIMDKDPTAFYHVSIEKIDELKFDPKNKYKSWLTNPNYFNPTGLWLSRGSEWIRFLISEFYSDQWSLSTYIYKVVPSDTVLSIKKPIQFLQFINKYRNKKCKTHECVIDWKKVFKHWDGLIISPYLGDRLLGDNANFISFQGDPKHVASFYKHIIGKGYRKHPMFMSQWYRHWEIGSCVIWHKRGVKSFEFVKKLNTFDHL